VPPHWLVLESATVNPAGSVSLNSTPVRSVVAFGLVTVNDSDVVPFSGMVAAPNNFWIVGGPTTIRVAVLLVVPVPPSVELIAPVVLFHTPVIEPVTVTLNWHIAPAASDPPLNEMVLGPVVVTEPPLHAGVGPELATVTPAGRVSLKLMPLRLSVAFGLVIVKVSEVVPPSNTLDIPNVLLTVGGKGARTAAVVVPPSPFFAFLAPDNTVDSAVTPASTMSTDTIVRCREMKRREW
jgi:hypothetical protein